MSKKGKTPDTEKKVFGNPEYGADEDIYSKAEKLELDDSGEEADEALATGQDLDVPGAELDNKDEKIGSEDEENNYYSIGGDNHDDLEEDKDE